jgi:NAD(P)-dependent dehydrogenase (short-subunit alcohol dehydrogenase family)
VAETSPTNFELPDKVVLVTGGTKGIGHGIVRQLLRAGARVAFTSRTALECAETATSLDAEFGAGRTFGMACDLADSAGVPGLVEAVHARWGRLDGLVCNAADTGKHGTVDTVAEENFARMLHTNVVNNFLLARATAQYLVRNGGGSITFITSIAATTPMPSNVAYAAAKAALRSVAASLAAEYAGTGVRVNCVAPGLIRSYSSRAVWEDEDVERSFVTQNIPMRRIGEAEEVGSVCVLLASSAGAYITAANIPVDGGRAGIGQVTGSPQLTALRTVAAT